jgi:hypothetical protein
MGALENKQSLAHASEPKSWVWLSTPESAENLALSVLALVETAIAITIYAWLAMKGYTLHVVMAACVAPFLLLRTDAAVELTLASGLALLRKSASISLSPFERVSSKGKRNLYHYLEQRGSRAHAWAYFWWDAADPRPEEFILRPKSKVSALSVVACMIFAPVLYVLGRIVLTLISGMLLITVRVGASIVSTLKAPLSSVRAIPTNWWRIVGCTDMHHPLEPLPRCFVRPECRGWFEENKLFLFVRNPMKQWRSSFEMGREMGRSFFSIYRSIWERMSESALAIWNVHLDLCKTVFDSGFGWRGVVAVLVFVFMYFLSVILLPIAIPVVFIVLLYPMVLALIGAIGIVLKGLVLIVIVVPALAYRWSLKGSSIIYLPLLWIVHLSTGGDIRARFISTCKVKFYKYRRIFSIFIILFIASKVLFVPLWNELYQFSHNYDSVGFIRVFVAPLEIPRWQMASAVNGILAWVMFFISDAAIKTAILNETEAIDTGFVVAARMMWFVTAVLSLYTITILIYNAASLEWNLLPIGNKWFPWQE